MWPLTFSHWDPNRECDWMPGMGVKAHVTTTPPEMLGKKRASERSGRALAPQSKREAATPPGPGSPRHSTPSREPLSLEPL